VGWAVAPWGSSWGTGVGGEPGVSPWDMLFGRQQGRVDPNGQPAVEGDYTFCLGIDGAAPEHLAELAVGDYIEVTQIGDFDIESYFHVPMQIRGPAEIAAGTSGWKISLRVGAVEHASRTFGADAVIDTTLTANVSAYVGDHTVAIRLELV